MSLSPVPSAPPPPRPFDDDEEDEGVGGKMSFLEHLDELRQRLIRVCSPAVFVGFVIAIVFIEPIFDFIMAPLQAILPAGGKLIYTEPTEAFMLYMKMAALVGLMLALPVLMWQVWAFIAPGPLRAREALRDPVRDDVDGVLHLGGALFSHYVVFPAMWSFFGSFADETVQFAPRIEPVFSLYVRMALGWASCSKCRRWSCSWPASASSPRASSSGTPSTPSSSSSSSRPS